MGGYRRGPETRIHTDCHRVCMHDSSSITLIECAKENKFANYFGMPVVYVRIIPRLLQMTIVLAKDLVESFILEVTKGD